MKIAIPVEERASAGSVCQSFGRAPFFLIHDTETDSNIYIDNSAASAQGGAGIKAAQVIVDEGVDALITPRCGQNAAEVIIGAKIKIYGVLDDSINENIHAFKEGRLPHLNEIHAGFHNHGRG
ncbi:MAG: dinitrogenase iron-molybdenum cofactor biosynthesis protein [Clostridia bacterium]|nr:dinitrogenase iron-molybdenum cofactor biosynthesis protein [Clostridia bacterium]